MGKSNKFDYTNRGSTGTKLGEIIGTALRKECEKVKRDAERHANKARKQSGSDAPESPATTHHLDLRAPSKQLGDDGVAAMADGLEEALKSGTATASLALEILNLSGNGLTVVSLARLAPVIRLARSDLKVLDLAHNSIKVDTDEESEQWETFLRAFETSSKIQHLNLSHNREMGHRALEALARVLQKEPPFDLPVNGHGSDQSQDCSDTASIDSAEGLADITDGCNEATPLTGNDHSVSRRCGLRSIPYLGLADITLKDFGSLWLSYVLTEHWFPVQLLPACDKDDEGIDWTEHSLGKDGLNLLHRAEELRRAKLLGSRRSPDAASLAALLESSSIADGNGNKAGKRRGPTPAAAGSGSKSTRPATSAHDIDHAELDSLRRKLQRLMIDTRPPTGEAELWAAALDLYITARKVFCLAPPGIHYRIKGAVPIMVVQRIAEFGISERRLGFMTARQRRAVIARAMSRESLTEEREWARKGASTQTWMLLDHISCLAYEGDEQ